MSQLSTLQGFSQKGLRTLEFDHTGISSQLLWPIYPFSVTPDVHSITIVHVTLVIYVYIRVKFRCNYINQLIPTYKSLLHPTSSTVDEELFKLSQEVVQINNSAHEAEGSTNLPCEVPLSTCVPHALTAGAEVRRPAALPACIAT